MDREKWKSNILMGGLCMLIPAIGPIVFSGYLFLVIESLKRDPDHKDYADFDFNRFQEYLMRGIWPFLMRLVLGLIIGMPLGLIAGVVMGVGGAVSAASESPVIFLLFYFLMFVIIMVVSIVSVLVTFPAELQAGLGREFNLPRMWAFVKDFNKRVFKEMVVSILFVMASAFVAEFAGILACCIGIYFTIAAVVMAQHHLLFQLYMLYLERGGSPIVPAENPSGSTQSSKDESHTVEPPEPDDRFRSEQ